MHYEILDHTADVMVRVYGETFSDLLVNSSIAMMDIMTDREIVAPTRKIEISASGNKPEILLVSWLEEINFLVETEKMLFNSFEVTTVSDTAVRGFGFGEEIDFDRHDLHSHIKAVTYHNLKVIKSDDGYTVEIVFDI